jgi:hypothetical protein
MPKPTKNKSRGPASRIKWPRNDSLKAWLQAMVQCCNAIRDDATAADSAHLPIKKLAEIGFASEALKHVNRFLRRLPKDKVLAIVRMAKLGAEFGLNSGDLILMDKYLAKIAATEPFNLRKCDKGFSLKYVRNFRAEHGLLDPEEALDDKERVRATFARAARQYQKAAAKGDRELARRAAAEMETAAAEVEPFYLQLPYRRRLVRCLVDANDLEAAKRCMTQFSPVDRHKIFDSQMLLTMGMKAEAVARAQQDVKQKLQELRITVDPNIHFPVRKICDALEFLFQQGESAEARRWLDIALKEMPTWPIVRAGWLTSAINEMLAQSVALINGPAAAEDLMKKAMAEAKIEKRDDFRKGAIDAAVQLNARVRGLDEAIAEAKKLRSPTGRRMNLGKLLARAKRWDELKELLGEAQSLEEAADISWRITFELPEPNLEN